jgi:hypothetical protein
MMADAFQSAGEDFPFAFGAGIAAGGGNPTRLRLSTHFATLLYRRPWLNLCQGFPAPGTGFRQKTGSSKVLKPSRSWSPDSRLI